jgi:deazaflavin-dependent oxidoreductase (nitroreductase family)
MAHVTSDDARPRQRIPGWIVRAIWRTHRGLYVLTGGRFGLRRPTASSWGMLRLHSTGRRTGKERIAILGYIEDGPNLVTPAMNGWMEPEPAWWLNLQAHPDTTVELPGRDRRDVHARAAVGEERERLWRRLVELGTSAYTDANSAMRPRGTAIVVLEPGVK